jgi:hypothetical protein
MTSRTLMLAAGGLAAGAAFAWWRSRDQVHLVRDLGGEAELANGRWARYLGGEDGGGLYVHCEDDENAIVPDAECAGVLREWPDITVSLAKRILMKAGSFVL